MLQGHAFQKDELLLVSGLKNSDVKCVSEWVGPYRGFLGDSPCLVGKGASFQSSRFLSSLRGTLRGAGALGNPKSGQGQRGSRGTAAPRGKLLSALPARATRPLVGGRLACCCQSPFWVVTLQVESCCRRVCFVEAKQKLKNFIL